LSRGFTITLGQRLKLRSVARRSPANAQGGCRLIPAKSTEGQLLTLVRYWPEASQKKVAAHLPLQFFGLERLQSPQPPTLLVCERPTDYLTLDYQLTVKLKTRASYDLIGLPSANVFKPEWVPYLMNFDEQVR
jgi:hypothetical protein